MKLATGIVAVLIGAQTVVLAATAVNYPNLDGLGDKGIGYQVLKLALRKSGGDYEVKQGAQAADQEQARSMLEQGQVDVIDTGVQASLDSKFDAVYKPMDRGILGWRLFIVNTANEGVIGGVKSISDLKKYAAAQGNGWGDIGILEAAGIKVKTAAQIQDVMGLIQNRQADFFPLGANEVFALLDRFGHGNAALTVDKNVVLVYPYGRLFYVKKGNAALKAAIEKGMDAALADGSLQKLLVLHPTFLDAFNKANLKHRTAIHIDSPGLPPEFKKIDAKWWYDPSK